MKKSVVIQEPAEAPTQVPPAQSGSKKSDERIKVAIRVRPKLKHEILRDSVVECNVQVSLIK